MNYESVNSTTAATDSSADTNDDGNFPLWRYVTKLERKGKGGNWSFQCKICNKIVVGSYARVRAHLLKLAGNGIVVCPRVTAGNKAEFLKLINEVDNKSLSRTVMQSHFHPVRAKGHLRHLQYQCRQVVKIRRERCPQLKRRLMMNVESI